MDQRIKRAAALAIPLALIGCKAIFTIGGTVSGLSGTGLTLRNNSTNSVAITVNGAFAFSELAAPNDAYAVTVASQPTNPSQTCAVTNGTGTVALTNVTDVAVTCVTNSYTLGGNASGIASSGLVIQYNGANDLAVTTDGDFSFPAALMSGTAYTVSIKTQPSAPNQLCSVANATGIIDSSTVNDIAISCRTLVGKYLYVPNTDSNNVSAYSIDPAAGTLTPIEGSPFAAGIAPYALTPDPSGRFLYSTNFGAPLTTVATNPTISGYSINGTTGVLTEVPESPFGFSGIIITTVNSASLMSPLKFSPSGKFAYSTSFYSLSMSVIGLSLDSVSGKLTPINGTPFPVVSGAVNAIPLGTFNNSGTRFYVPFGSNGGVPASLFAPSGIRTYDVDPTTGVLSAISAPPLPTGGLNPLTASTNASNKYLFVPNQTTGSIAVYANDPISGDLSAVPGSPFATGGTLTSIIAVHPSGRFVYVANGNSQQTPSPVTLAAFSVDALNGSLTAMPGSPMATQGTNLLRDTSTTAIDASGKFVYVNNTGSNSIAAYAINQTTGALTEVPGSPFATGARPTAPTPDPSGKYLYVVNRDANSISSYAINATTGALALISTAPTGTRPVFPNIIGLQ